MWVSHTMHASHAFVTYRDGRGAILRNLWAVITITAAGSRPWPAARAKKEVPPVMHDLIIFRALFSDSIPLSH